MGLLSRILTEKIHLTKSISELRDMQEGEIETRVRCYINHSDINFTYNPLKGTLSQADLVVINGSLDQMISAGFSGSLSFQDFRKMEKCLKETKRPKEYALTGVYHAGSNWLEIDTIRCGNYTIFPERVEYKKK